MRPISLAASWPHYLDHLIPVWDALPRELHGGVAVRSKALPRARELKLKPLTREVDATSALLVAGWADQRRHRGPVALMEHGAGQTYTRHDGSVHASYVGGVQRERVGLFLCPSRRTARLNQEAYPDARVEVVGCPKLDRWLPSPPEPEPMTVAFAFHWNAGVVPETRWAFPHYRQELPATINRLRAAGVTVLGHGHPRAAERLKVYWKRLEVPWASADEVLERAAVLVVDNSSLAMEHLALGREVVWLSCPLYRRDVAHGGRFWEWVSTGEHVDDPDQLYEAVMRVLDHPGERHDERRRVVEDTYTYLDGHCATRAATAITSWLGVG